MHTAVKLGEMLGVWGKPPKHMRFLNTKIKYSVYTKNKYKNLFFFRINVQKEFYSNKKLSFVKTAYVKGIIFKKNFSTCLTKPSHARAQVVKTYRHVLPISKNFNYVLPNQSFFALKQQQELRIMKTCSKL